VRRPQHRRFAAGVHLLGLPVVHWHPHVHPDIAAPASALLERQHSAPHLLRRAQRPAPERRKQRRLAHPGRPRLGSPWSARRASGPCAEERCEARVRGGAEKEQREKVLVREEVRGGAGAPGAMREQLFGAPAHRRVRQRPAARVTRSGGLHGHGEERAAGCGRAGRHPSVGDDAERSTMSRRAGGGSPAGGRLDETHGASD